MSFSPEIHVSDAHTPKPAMFRRGQAARESAHVFTRARNFPEEHLRPILNGIREPRFDATIRFQLLGCLNFFAVG